ncbi:MAG: transposase [Candidatus Riflebacteria bacterium]|nr:transposase [Candidatus Riflebacteria bacterium]
MSSITRQRVGKYTYLYESKSYRDKFGRPRNTKTRVGKFNPVIGEDIYDQCYIDKMAATGTSIQNPETKPSNAEQREIALSIFDSIRNYGVHFLLLSIAKRIGLIDILSASTANCWQEIFTLACYLVQSDKPLMYCEDWASETETLPAGTMSSQRISELLTVIGTSHRNAFYKSWGRHIAEQECIALDITSVSSYSELMTECEWGYNRDQEDLPQINLCMLMGETSRLPIYQTVYSGSLTDVATLKNTLKELTALIPEKRLRVVMDKGFYSAKNVNAMLEAHDMYRAKDVVEKGFCGLKNALGLDRLRVHSDERMQNKLFVGFIALIMMSHLHKVMSGKRLYKNLSMDKLLITLSKIKTARINGTRFIRPVTKEQREILAAFDLEMSVG